MLEWLPELKTLQGHEEPGRHCARATPNHPDAWNSPNLQRSRWCCNFHPILPNYLIGSIFTTGTAAARSTVRARIEQGDNGVSVTGILPGNYWDTLEPIMNDRVCPYHDSQENECTLGTHQNGTCRTWICETKTRRTGWEMWRTAQQALEHAELLLARRCVDACPTPRPTHTEQWVQWYIWCAGFAAGLQGAEGTPTTLIPFRSDLQRAVQGNEKTLPERFIPTVPSFQIEGDDVLFRTDSLLDQQRYPKETLQLFALLDGSTTWREALQKLREQENTSISETDVCDLFRANIIEAAPDSPVQPWPSLPWQRRKNAWNTIVPAQKLIPVASAQIEEISPSIHVHQGPGFHYLTSKVSSETISATRAMLETRKDSGAFRRASNKNIPIPHQSCARASVESTGIAATLFDTGYDIHEWKEPTLHTLVQEACEHASLFHRWSHGEELPFELVDIWSHLTRAGGSMAYHSHGGVQGSTTIGYSIVYYADIGSPDPENPNSGCVSLLDPGLCRESIFRPETGEMMMFPDWAVHGVIPYSGEQDRYIVGINVMYQPD